MRDERALHVTGRGSLEEEQIGDRDVVTPRAPGNPHAERIEERADAR